MGSHESGSDCGILIKKSVMLLLPKGKVHSQEFFGELGIDPRADAQAGVLAHGGEFPLPRILSESSAARVEVDVTDGTRQVLITER